MLDFIRKNAQSWMVKALFGLIVIVFVFWGVGSFRSDKSSTIATVNGSPILVKDYSQLYQRAVQNLRSQNPEISTEDLEQIGLKRQVLDQMIESHLLTEKAQEWGISVSSSELSSEIRSIPAFQTEEQLFDPARYVAVLQSNRLTPQQFESDYLHSLLMDKIKQYAQLPTQVSPAEARDFFNFAREQVRMEYVLFPLDQYRDQVEPDPAQIQTYFEANPQQFRVPEQIQLEYLLFSPANLARFQEVTQEELRTHYEQNKEDFRQEEQVKARHILIKLDEDASEEEEQSALTRIEMIKSELPEQDFGELASQHSEGPSSVRGGDLGWFGRGQMVSEFEEVAFSLEPGTVSEPVRTQFGYHLIKVEEHRDSSIPPLEEVADSVRARIAEEKAMDAMSDLLDQVLERTATGEDLTQAAEAAGLETRRTDFFSRESMPSGLALPPESLAVLFSLQEGEVTESPIILDEGYLLAQKAATREEHIRPLEEVKSRIKTVLRNQGARELAQEKAQALLPELRKGEALPEGTQQPVTSEPFARSGMIPELGMNPELTGDLFAANPGTWLDRTYDVEKGVILARLSERILPSEEEWQQQKDFWFSTLERIRGQELYQSFLETLRAEAEIILVNPDFLEY